MNIATLITSTGKTIQDFRIPQSLLDGDHELITLIMGSEAMDDSERQYWFNLTEVMNADQTQKLRDILTREKEKLEEIYKKYGKKPEVTPEAAAKKAEITTQAKQAEQAKRQAAEAAEEAQADAAAEESLNEDLWA